MSPLSRICRGMFARCINDRPNTEVMVMTKSINSEDNLLNKYLESDGGPYWGHPYRGDPTKEFMAKVKYPIQLAEMLVPDRKGLLIHGLDRSKQFVATDKSDGSWCTVQYIGSGPMPMNILRKLKPGKMSIYADNRGPDSKLEETEPNMFGWLWDGLAWIFMQFKDVWNYWSSRWLIFTSKSNIRTIKRMNKKDKKRERRLRTKEDNERPIKEYDLITTLEEKSMPELKILDAQFEDWESEEYKEKKQ